MLKNLRVRSVQGVHHTRLQTLGPTTHPVFAHLQYEHTDQANHGVPSFVGSTRPTFSASITGHA